MIFQLDKLHGTKLMTLKKMNGKLYTYSPSRVTSYSALQWFQISINHNILVTNKLLQQMKIKDDALCTFCHSNNESIVHLFWQCSKTQQFIRSVSAWLSEYGIDCNISEKYIIFGWQEGQCFTNVPNFIIL